MHPQKPASWAGPLKLHLSLLIILLLLGVALPLIWMAHQRGEAAAETAADEKMQLLSERTTDRFRIVFGDAVPLVSMAAISDAFATPPPADLPAKTRLLLEGLAGSPNLDGLYVGYGDGSFIHVVSLDNDKTWRKVLGAPAEATFALRVIAREPANGNMSSVWRFLGRDGRVVAALAPTEASYDPRTRPWYQRALATPDISSVGPYVTATTRALALTLSQRHHDANGAVAGADILLATIGHFLDSEKVSPRATSFILDDTRDLLIHSDPNLMEKLLLLRGRKTRVSADDPNISDATIAAARSALPAAEGSFVFEVAGEPYLGQAAPITFSPLLAGNTLVITAPLSDFTAANEELLRRALVVSGLLLAIGIIAAILIARLITRSLSSLTEDAMRLSDFEFGKAAPESTYIREINSLSAAIAAARDAIRSFALYVPRELVRKIVTSRGDSQSGAARQEVTVMFTDIRDFTTISERHSPEEVVAMLSTYFELMNKGVERHKGAIIQFLGDSVFAMWNAPVPDPDHAGNACRCALDLAAALIQFNAGQRAEGRPEFVTRFGLHSGAAVVGSVGAERRLVYTAMGDTVNVASRLEGINKEFGTTIMTSRALKDRCEGNFIFRRLGFHQAKGRAEKVELFELVSRR
ncbi:adenylate/guanylate cyclase domain-containing protein [Nordella sp. HKS 07]|nr:adenylate/guanylate cyclase domain-containing protein [Nordella sp. HKS 07]